MRITKVYTRSGDKGHTRLVGGQSVPKDHPRIAAYGTVDELNSVLGQARGFAAREAGHEEVRERLEALLVRVQNELFDLGADLATRPEDRWEGMKTVGEAEVRALEATIDELNDLVPPLEEFILPAGGVVASTLHVARCVCRRAEREAVALARGEDLGEGGALKYLNRLSDLLFVAARWYSRSTGEAESLWRRDR